MLLTRSSSSDPTIKLVSWAFAEIKFEGREEMRNKNYWELFGNVFSFRRLGARPSVTVKKGRS